MKPLSIFSHNLLQSYVGDNEDGPVVQVATLAEIGQLDTFNYFTAKLWQLVNHGNLPTPPRNVLGELKAEWRTVLPILAHFAYNSQLSFHPTQFAAGLVSPNIWLGQSYYRIRRLLNSDIPKTSDIESSILLVAHYEAAAVVLALEDACSSLVNPVILNSDQFDQQSIEQAHEVI